MLLIIYRSRSIKFYHMTITITTMLLCVTYLGTTYIFCFCTARLYTIILHGYYFTLAEEIENLWWYIFFNSKVYLPFFCSFSCRSLHLWISFPYNNGKMKQLEICFSDNEVVIMKIAFFSRLFKRLFFKLSMIFFEIWFFSSIPSVMVFLITRA